MGMDAVCPNCGHSQRSDNHRGARLGDCPRCGTPMRGHTAGRAKGRYICPVNGGVITLGLRYTVQLTEPMRLEFVPGWDTNYTDPDPDRPGFLRTVRYQRTEPTQREQEQLDHAAGRVLGPGCVVSRDFEPYEPGDRYHGKAGVFLFPVPGADPAAWFVNEPVRYKKCAACPKRVVASDKTRIDQEWVPARENYWRGHRSINVSRGPHPAGTYACPDCRPPASRGADQPEQAAANAAGAARQDAPAGHEPAAAPALDQGARVTDEEHGQADCATIHDAVARLAGVCDFAESQDGQGFNATDTWLGHALAAMPATEWTADQALAAWDMLRKYSGQLDGFGMPYARLPRPDGAGELEEARRAEARERARQGVRRWRDQQYRKARSYVRCDGEDEQVTLAFPYDPELVSQAKRITGRSFDWDGKDNVYPFTSLPAVVALAEAHGIDVAPEVQALVLVAVASAQQDAARPSVYTDKAGQVVVSAEYNPRLNEALKELNGGRSTWDRRARVHVAPTHRDPGRVLAIADEFGLTVGEDARAAITEQQDRHDRNEAAGTAFEADPVPIPGLAEGLSLKPQQYPVVRFAREHRRVLIGDDMGWGKTASSLAAVAVDGAYPAVVMCRPSLTLNWVAEIRRFFPTLAVHEASGSTPQPVPGGTDVIVIGSAALAANPEKTQAGGKEFGWVKTLAAVAPKALIIDEGQDTKERGANRSQACEQLAASVIGRDGLVLDLTGTAILNRPRELCQQLSILGRIGEFGGPKAFMWRYCLSEMNQWGASYNGARNLIELHDRLLRWGIMIRRADDAKLGLPPCREHVLHIPQPDLDPAVMDRYRRAEADLLAFLAEQARQAAKKLGQDPNSAAVQATVRASAAEHLVAINTLRQLAGHAKRSYVTAWIRERVAAGEKVMVAAHHRDEVDAYAAVFGGLKLQGGQTVAGKEAAKAAFQQQLAGQAPVIAVSIGAGGVGHTLTAARIGIQAEQAWTPGETQQMKKRLHRIGQDRPVDYYITVAERTIDEHLWDVVTTKQATLDAVLDGTTDLGTADDEKSVAAELAWRLTQQGLGTSPESDSGHANPPGSQEPASVLGRNHREDAPDDESRPVSTQTASKAVSRYQQEDGEGQARTEPDTVSSILGDEALARMRTEAAANVSPFVDPALLREADALLPVADRGWLERVMGHAVPSYRSLPHAELLLAVRAAKSDAAHLRALADSRRAETEHASQHQAETAEAAARAEQDAWQVLRSKLPVPVSVQHNWTARHLEGYEQGGNHIVVRQDLNAGRFHRAAGAALCWTPSRASELRRVSGNLGDENRLPDCQACLRHAEKLAAGDRASAIGESPRADTVGRTGGMPANRGPAAVHAERALAWPQGPPGSNSSGANHTAQRAQQSGIPTARFDAECQQTSETASIPAEDNAVADGYLPGTGRTTSLTVAAPCRYCGRDAWQADGHVPRHICCQTWATLIAQGYDCPSCTASTWLAAGGHGPVPPIPRGVPQIPAQLLLTCGILGCGASAHRYPEGNRCGHHHPGGTGHTSGPPRPTPGSDGDDDHAMSASVPAQLRAFAHRYLGHGLLPVPAWPVLQNGECCCPRGADCPRPGKHPRSVYVGPGRRGYSWKPLACHTHEDVEERFADGGQYAGANLMLAIPAGMMVVDIDHDDGGHQAIAKLAARLGGLPATLGHQTPHGEHRIYLTPPGWIGRAWVGKDARNPLPAGIDLRMPGQILMAPPSRVPGPGGHLEYGPPAGDTVIGLPPAYVAAWTPPQPAARRPQRVIPVAPDAAERAASYVHTKITSVLADLSSHEPGGRNTAIYTAALKIGSVLGAARSTPGAEHAADGWTDEGAYDALMDAATQNGYVDAHGATMARSAVRSGLRNGLRSPRALPDFTNRLPAWGSGTRRGRARREPGKTAHAESRPAPTGQEPDAGPAPGPPGSARPPVPSVHDAAMSHRVAAALWAAGYMASIPGHQADGRTGYRMRALADGGLLIQPADDIGDIDGAAAADRTMRTLDRYASALRDAGFKITRPGAGNLVVLPQPAGVETGRHTPSGVPGQRNRMQANRAAVAANEAYCAAEFDRARQLTSEAAALDPSRAALWQLHRSQIDARELFLQARAAHGEADQYRAQMLVDQARQLDPRMQALWDRSLPRTHGGERGHHARADGPPGGDQRPGRSAPDSVRRRTVRQADGPQWPAKPFLYRAPGVGSQPRRDVSAARAEPTLSGAAEPSAEESETAEPERTGDVPAPAWRPLQIRDSQTAPPKGRGPASPPGRESDTQDARADADRHAATGPAPNPHRRGEVSHRLGREPAGPRRAPRESARQADTTDWRDVVIKKERQEWQPRLAQPGSPAPSAVHVDVDGPEPSV